jgi:hypothetical protein
VSLASGTRLRVLRGDPTPEQIAALVLALDQAEPEAPTVPRRGGWQLAARLEGLGGLRIGSASDARLYRGRRPTEP